MNAPQRQPLDGRRSMLALGALVAANRDLNEAVAQVSDDILANDKVTPGERGLLTMVRRHRALTVPRLAEHQGTSRQHIQVAVNGLVKKGLLGLQANPAHRRSKLVVLTPGGEDLIRRILSHEGDVMNRVAAGLDPERVQGAVEVLGQVLGLVRDDKGGF